MRAAWARAARAGSVLVVAAAAWQPSPAAALRYCDAATPLSAVQQDRLLRFAALIKSELEDSGQPVALVARSGLDLRRFGQRYSHAGISLQASSNAPWSVRQLYYACDERRPKIFDQGLPGFLLGSDDPGIGFVTLLLLPASAAAAIESVALDNPRSLQLLGSSYSANAYPFSPLHQNCNQWVMELLALAWSDEATGANRATAGSGANEANEANGANRSELQAPGTEARQRAQRWLRDQGYAPTVFDVGSRPLMWLAQAVPWLHEDDHPREDLAQALYRVSMPASIEAFVMARFPASTRLEFCHAQGRAVLRRGGAPLPDDCLPADGDRVVRLDD